jgi:phospholipid transport system substrate-binding protein
MRRNSILRLALVLLTALALHARPAAAQGDPRAFMTDMGNNLLRIINDRKAPETARRQEFQQLGERAFDIPRIAQFALGRYWRTATDDQKQRFIKAFETYMVAVYWTHFSSYSGESFKVTGAQDEGNGTTDVTTDILRPDANQPPVKLTWQLTKSGDTYKIRDANLEGISQAQTYRDEFSSILERSGGNVSALIDQLNDRAKSGAG